MTAELYRLSPDDAATRRECEAVRRYLTGVTCEDKDRGILYRMDSAGTRIERVNCRLSTLRRVFSLLASKARW